MDYREMQSAFARRRNGADYKTISSLVRAKQSPCGSFQFYLKWRGAHETFATLRSNDELELHCSDAGIRQYMNPFMKVAEFGSVFSNSAKYGKHVHKLRFSPRTSSIEKYSSVPFRSGLVVNTRTRTVVRAPDDPMVVPKSDDVKKVREFLKGVSRVMDVLHRIDGLGAEAKKWSNYGITSRISLDMTDENLSEMACAVYKEGFGRAEEAKTTDWVEPPGGGAPHFVQIPEAQWKAEHYARVKRVGMKYLQQALLKQHGQFQIVYNNQGEK